MSQLTDSETARLHPETLALSYGFDPWLSEGAVKPPVFLTSTFAFKHAADGKQFFAWASRRISCRRASMRRTWRHR